MKKLFFVLAIILTSATSMACDICGCGVGSQYIGILPEFRKHIIGLRYRPNSMISHLGAGGATTHLTTRETYQTVEVWGGWNIGKKFRVMAIIPWHINSRTNNGITQSKNGLGDISATGFYQLINNRKQVFNQKLLIQSLWIGAGIKLPAGKYDVADKSTTAQSANLFQLGTGSIDYLLASMYDIRLQDAGLNVAMNYRINSLNKEKYGYGNKFSLNVQDRKSVV